MQSRIHLVSKLGLASSVVLVLAMASQACVGSKNPTPAPPPAAGGSGAFGVVTVNGMQKLYLPTPTLLPNGNGQVIVVDVGVQGSGVQGASAQVTTIDLGVPAAVATATGGDSNMILAVSIYTPTIWFIDPKSDTLVKTTSLGPDAGTSNFAAGTSNFSGGGGYITGIAMDSAHNRAILSVWDGFAIVDMNTQTVTSTIQAAPTENFGFDSVNQRIIDPFYDCTSASSGSGPLTLCDQYKTPSGATQTDGLLVIDLTDNSVYQFVDPTATTPETPVGTEPDSASVDVTTGVTVVPSEGGDYQNILDLSKATFDKTAKTFTAPHKYIQNQGLTGIAIEPTAHFGFWEEEHGADVGVANVNDANSGSAAFVHAYMPTTPDGSSWSNMGDPHGIAVATGIANGKPVGFVVSSDAHWVARVDLQTMAAAGAVDAGQFAVGPDISAAVTYLDATIKEGQPEPSLDAGALTP